MPKSHSSVHPDVANASCQGPAWRWILVAAALAIHVGLVLSIAKQPLPVNRAPAARRAVIWPLHNDTVHRVGPAADAFAVYHAGNNLKNGHNPYDVREAPQVTPYFYPFRYLPAVGQTLGRAAVALTPRHAWWAWIAVLEVLLAALIIVFWHRAPDWRLRCFSSCVLLLSSPYMLELHMGQFTFATLAILVLGLLIAEGSTQHRGVALVVSSAALSAAAMLKVFPLVVTPALVRFRRYLPAIAISGATVVLVSLTYFLPNPASWQTFHRANFSSPVGGMDAGNYGVVFLIHQIAFAIPIEWITRDWLGFASSFRTLALVLTSALVCLSRCDRVLIPVSVMILAHFVGYIHVWEHHMSGVVVAGLALLLALVLPTSSKGPPKLAHPHPAVLAFVVMAVLALALPTPFALFDQAKDPTIEDPSVDWPLWQRLTLVASKAIPTLVLYGIGLGTLVSAGVGLPWPWFYLPPDRHQPRERRNQRKRGTHRRGLRR